MTGPKCVVTFGGTKREWKFKLMIDPANRACMPRFTIELPKKWIATETGAAERRNLFCIEPGHEAHIATLVAGSRTHLSRFDACVRLIEASPLLVASLEEVAQVLDEIRFVQDPRVRLVTRRVDALMRNLGS